MPLNGLNICIANTTTHTIQSSNRIPWCPKGFSGLKCRYKCRYKYPNCGDRCQSLCKNLIFAIISSTGKWDCKVTTENYQLYNDFHVFYFHINLLYTYSLEYFFPSTLGRKYSPREQFTLGVRLKSFSTHNQWISVLQIILMSILWTSVLLL